MLRPGTMSINLAGTFPAAVGVRSTRTVTNESSSPERWVCFHTCSSTPRTPHPVQMACVGVDELPAGIQSQLVDQIPTNP